MTVGNKKTRVAGAGEGGVVRCRGCKQKRIKNLTLCVPKGVDVGCGLWGRFSVLPSAVDANGIKISCHCIFLFFLPPGKMLKGKGQGQLYAMK